jgi:hypothetical protein
MILAKSFKRIHIGHYPLLSFKKTMQKTKKYSSEMASSLCLKERAKAPQIRILHLTVTG